jgi:hypothetical protein
MYECNRSVPLHFPKPIHTVRSFQGYCTWDFSLFARAALVFAICNWSVRSNITIKAHDNITVRGYRSHVLLFVLRL